MMHTTTATTNTKYCCLLCLMCLLLCYGNTDNDGFLAIDDLEMIVGGDHTSEEVKEAIRHFDKVSTVFYFLICMHASLLLRAKVCEHNTLSSCATRQTLTVWPTMRYTCAGTTTVHCRKLRILVHC
jgi:hypothetical protein